MEAALWTALFILNFPHLEQNNLYRYGIMGLQPSYLSVARCEKICAAFIFARQKARSNVAPAKTSARRKMKDAVDRAQRKCNKYKLNFELAIFAEKRPTFLGHVQREKFTLCTSTEQKRLLQCESTQPSLFLSHARAKNSSHWSKTDRHRAIFLTLACKIHARVVERKFALGARSGF